MSPALTISAAAPEVSAPSASERSSTSSGSEPSVPSIEPRSLAQSCSSAELGAVGLDGGVDLGDRVVDRGEAILEVVAADGGGAGEGEAGEQLAGRLDDADADALLGAEGDLRVLRLHVGTAHDGHGDDEDETDQRELVREAEAGEEADGRVEELTHDCQLIDNSA